MTTLALAGDVMLGRLVSDIVIKNPPAQPWGDLLAIMGGADARLVNLECAITRHRQRWTRTDKVFHFRADPRVIEVLHVARIDAVALANNHVFDYNEAGLLDTLQYLDRAGIAHAGAGHDLAEACQPALVDAGGCRVALIAITDNEPPFAATSERPGTRYLPIDPASLPALQQQVRAARGAGAALVVLSCHWGPNMVERPPAHFCAFARAAVDLGVDLFHGHSAHLCQGVEIHHGKPILYDTGDFLDDYAVDPWWRNDWSFLFLVTFEHGRLTRLELVPALLTLARVQCAPEPERSALCRRMRALSAEFGTDLIEAGERLRWQAGDGGDAGA
ncbi:CapA family protein [Pseudogulbenkiania ferrooxidans]|uniref:Poly-gamma-glutamate synthesis protein (Capsule biosynthesis protein) n=1 Tax=Pseudogulbenkiania ferrooxidans 2002 TaxID=279714 RepID=B9Z818_9NEIS|nr:CapA family protein [Pseudogulbenkiania ferrooxidans]EEG07073.1 poly-gamma-glutamate synthesis protein (capsule biosynthesis protein) [Pseudogulbenkiania ferrooxidans 2002]